MYGNYIYRDINAALPGLLRAVLAGPEVGSRAGRTRELTHVGITLTKPLNREILVPGRRANLAAQIAETAWVLAGRNDVEFLSHYLPRAADFSDDGKTWRSGYGPRLRKWNFVDYSDNPSDCDTWIDQMAYVVDALRTDPETRQAVINLWDPKVDEQPGKDRACNNWLHFLSREGSLDLHVAIRSNDLMWGWSGINAFEWSVLLEVVAGLTGLSVGALHFSTTSLHLYERHWEKAQRIIEEAAKTERVTAEPSPRFRMRSEDWELGEPGIESLDAVLERWFHVEYDIRTGSPLVQPYIDSFPEPMLKSWLQVLDWWWNGPCFASLPGDALAVAAGMGVKPPWFKSVEHNAAVVHDYLGGPDKLRSMVGPPFSPFLAHAITTHNEKHAAYGDSWKRRGEMLGIMANIARKVDRLGGSETADETSADTAMDLMVYLAKMRTWLWDQEGVSFGRSETPDAANELLVQVEREMTHWFHAGPLDLDQCRRLEGDLRAEFDQLETKVVEGSSTRHVLVESMLRNAYLLARSLFERQQETEEERKAQKTANEEINQRVYEEFLPGSTGNPMEYRGADGHE